MLRSEVLQPLIDLSKRKRYLEIGVEGGITFQAICAEKKVAVDPIFRFDLPSERFTREIEYHEITSDDYFGIITKHELFDVIYIDGLHTFEQTLRDLLNSIEHLDEGGVIVVDDVLPTSWAASLDKQSDAAFVRDLLAAERFDGNNWMGPVFKLVYFISTFMPGYDFATIQDNHGQLVMWRSIQKAPFTPDMSIDDISRIDFLAVIKDKTAFRLALYSEIYKAYRLAITGT